MDEKTSKLEEQIHIQIGKLDNILKEINAEKEVVEKEKERLVKLYSPLSNQAIKVMGRACGLKIFRDSLKKVENIESLFGGNGKFHKYVIYKYSFRKD